MLSEKGRAAVEYAKRGWYVIPLCWPDEEGHCACFKCHSDERAGKAPLLDIGYQNLRPSVEQVVDWWTKWPEANIGLLLRQSGLIDIESDSEEAELELMEKGIDKLERFEYSSGRGIHRLFKAFPGIEDVVSRRIIKAGKSRGIDILADGYTILPPSVHRSGNVYKVLYNGEPGIPPIFVAEYFLNLEKIEKKELEIEFSDVLPDVDVEKLNIPFYVKDLAIRGLEADCEGRYPSRSEAQFAFIRYMLKLGYDYDTIASILLDKRYKIGEKARERKNPLEYIAHEIAKVIVTDKYNAQGDGGEDDLLLDGIEVLDDRKLPIYRLDEFEPKEPSWLIEDVLQTGFNILAGITGDGKSYFVRQLATCVAKGEDFLGHKVVTPTKVLYICHPFEGIDTDIKKHFIDLGAPPDRIYICRAPLTKRQLNEDVVEYIKKEGIGLVILDTIARYITLEDGYLAEYYKVRNALEEVREFLNCATVLGITHKSKSGDTYSPATAAIGSTEWGASANSRIQITAVRATNEMCPEGAKPGEILYHKISITNRGGKPIPETKLKFDGVFYRLMDEDEYIEKQAFKSELDNILSHIPEDDFIRGEELSELLGISIATLKRRMKILVDTGAVISKRNKGYQKVRVRINK